ncbi:MAG: hypothetical protein ACRD8W_07655 [Nitrososphaeraceae archaeon]
MLSYGYAKNTIGWVDERKEELSEQLDAMLHNRAYNWTNDIEQNLLPRIDFNTRYQNYIGVAIINLEYLGKQDIIELLDRADQIYLDVMIPELSGRTFIGKLIPADDKWTRGAVYNNNALKECGYELQGIARSNKSAGSGYYQANPADDSTASYPDLHKHE